MGYSTSVFEDPTRAFPGYRWISRSKSSAFRYSLASSFAWQYSRWWWWSLPSSSSLLCFSSTPMVQTFAFVRVVVVAASPRRTGVAKTQTTDTSSKVFFPLFLHDEEFCKIFKELNAVDGAFCLSVSKRGFVLLFLLLLLEEKPPFISSKSPSSSNSSSLNASSSDRGRLWETRTRGVFSTPPLEMESSIFFFFCVSSEERSSPFLNFFRQIFHFVSFITFCVCCVSAKLW